MQKISYTYANLFFQIWESSNKQTTDLPSIFERPSPLFESYDFVSGQILNPFIEFFDCKVS